MRRCRCPASAVSPNRRLLHQAQAAGAVRPDVSFEDLVCVVTAISLATGEDEASQTRIPHLLGLFLEGIFLEGMGRR